MHDTRRFLIAFGLMWAVFLGEFLLLHVRRAPAPVAFLRHADLELALDPQAGRARVSALLELDAPEGARARRVALVLPTAATDVSVRGPDGEPLSGRWRSHERVYLTGRPAEEGRTWRLLRHLQPRLDLRLPRGPEPAPLRIEFDLDGKKLRGPSSIQPGRSLLLGSWVPTLEAAPGQAAPAFTYRLLVRTPAAESAVASGDLVRRLPEGGWEASEWRSPWPASAPWVASAPFTALAASAGRSRVRVYVGRGRQAELARQIAGDALQALRAIEPWAGPLADTEWQLAALDRLAAIGRGQPPLVLLDAGLFRRPAERPASRHERRAWIAREMARAWLRPPPPPAGRETAEGLTAALGAALAQIALSSPPPASPAARPAAASPEALQQRIEWMMRCRAYAEQSAPRPPLDAGGKPTTGVLAATKLPAALDTLASQIGEAEFVALAAGQAGEGFLRRLRESPRGRALAAILTRDWLPDLSVEAVEVSGDGVRARIADRGLHGGVPLRVEVRLLTPAGAVRVERVDLPAGGAAEVRFRAARSWRRVEVDPQRRIFQIEYGNDALPRQANPWTALQATWDARRWIARGEFARAVEAGKEATRLDPSLREADYWVGFALVKLGQAAEAAPWLERARAGPLDNDVVAAETLYLLGQAYQAAGDVGRASELYRQVLREEWTSFSAERARRALKELDAEADPVPAGPSPSRGRAELDG